MSPSGWATSSLADVAEGGLFVDGDWVESKDQDPTGSVRLTQLADVGIAKFRDRSDRWMRPDQADRLRCTRLKAGDILIARMPDPIGRACLVPSGLGVAVTAVDVAILRIVRSDVDPRFIMWAVNSPGVHAEVVSHQAGTTRKRISRKNLAQLTVPLPPLDEQRRIVNVLEDHLSRLDAADALLTGSLHRQQGLRRSLLHAATEGESVPLGELTVTSGYGTSTKCVVGGPGTPVVRIPNLTSGRVDLTDEKRVADPTLDVSHLLLQPDDLLVVRTNGSRDLIGRSAVVQDGVVAAFASYLIRFQLDAARVRPRWVAQMLHSPALRERLESLAASSAGQYNLGLAKLHSVAIPVPPLARQDAILAELEEQMSLVAASQREVETALSRSAALRRSLLGAAFVGGL